MSLTGPSSRAASGTASLVGLAVLGLLGLLGRKPEPSLAVAPSGGSRSDVAGGSVPRGQRRDAGAGDPPAGHKGDSAPGEPREGQTDVAAGIRAYLIGLGLAVLLTAGSFTLSYTHLVYGPAVPVALIVFAVAQIGIHLVFFLHLTTAPDNINNAMALAFGTLILLLLIGGTLWIMGHMNANMMPMTGHDTGHAMQMNGSM